MEGDIIAQRGGGYYNTKRLQISHIITVGYSHRWQKDLTESTI